MECRFVTVAIQVFTTPSLRYCNARFSYWRDAPHLQRLSELGPFLREAGVGQSWDGPVKRNVLLQRDPGSAAAVAFQHRQLDGLRQMEHSHHQGVNVLFPAPIEPLRDHVIAPNVLAAQPFRLSQRVQALPSSDFAEELDSHTVCRWNTGSNLIKS